MTLELRRQSDINVAASDLGLVDLESSSFTQDPRFSSRIRV